MWANVKTNGNFSAPAGLIATGKQHQEMRIAGSGDR
jgi:hypothetical protein